MTLATAARTVVRRRRPVNTSGIPLAADEMTAGRRLHRLATVASRPPPGGIVGAATRYRGRHLASVTNVIVSVLHRGERAHGTGTGTVLVITIAEEMIHGTDTGTTDVHERVYSLGVSI